MKLKLTALFLIVVGLSVHAYPKSHGRHFVTPSKPTCLRHGGRWNSNFGVCEANWRKAKKICRASGGRLPSLNELKRVVRSCGGVPRGKISNEKTHYTDDLCYKYLGIGYISGHDYWTSTFGKQIAHVDRVYIMSIDINSGYYGNGESRLPHYITCVK